MLPLNVSLMASFVQEDGGKAETWMAHWWGERTAWAKFLAFTQVVQSAVQKLMYYTYRRSHFHLNLMEMMFSAPWMELCSPGEVTTPIWRSSVAQAKITLLRAFLMLTIESFGLLYTRGIRLNTHWLVNSGGIQLYKCNDPGSCCVIINSTGCEAVYNHHNNNNIKAKVRFCFERSHNIELWPTRKQIPAGKKKKNYKQTLIFHGGKMKFCHSEKMRMGDK